MPLIYITGMSGSGKSSVLRKLEELGYATYGVDELGYADWVDRQTGEIIPFPEEEDSVDIHEWYVKHRWVLSKDRIGRLKKQVDADDKLAFLGGMSEGIDDVWRYFDNVLLLTIDIETIQERITNRTDNDFGKAPDEMAAIMSALEPYETKCKRLGAITVDATQPLKKVVQEIIEIGEST